LDVTYLGDAAYREETLLHILEPQNHFKLSFQTERDDHSIYVVSLEYNLGDTLQMICDLISTNNDKAIKRAQRFLVMAALHDAMADDGAMPWLPFANLFIEVDGKPPIYAEEDNDFRIDGASSLTDAHIDMLSHIADLNRARITPDGKDLLTSRQYSNIQNQFEQGRLVDFAKQALDFGKRMSRSKTKVNWSVRDKVLTCVNDKMEVKAVASRYGVVSTGDVDYSGGGDFSGGSGGSGGSASGSGAGWAVAALTAACTLAVSFLSPGRA
jgi:hypothetical protein